MTIKYFIRIAGGVVLALVLLVVIRSFLRSEEAAAEHALSVELIDEALGVRGDFSEALRLAADALHRYPEDARLYLLQARAFHGRGRLSDALRSLEKASQFSEDSEEGLEIRFYSASSRALRFLETGDRDDFNLAEGDLRLMGEGGRFSAAAQILLGLALAQPSHFQDRQAARRLLQEGLQGDAAPEGILELERARKALRALETP